MPKFKHPTSKLHKPNKTNKLQGLIKQKNTTILTPTSFRFTTDTIKNIEILYTNINKNSNRFISKTRIIEALIEIGLNKYQADIFEVFNITLSD